MRSDKEASLRRACCVPVFGKVQIVKEELVDARCHVMANTWRQKVRTRKLPVFKSLANYARMRSSPCENPSGKSLSKRSTLSLKASIFNENHQLTHQLHTISRFKPRNELRCSQEHRLLFGRWGTR